MCSKNFEFVSFLGFDGYSQSGNYMKHIFIMKILSVNACERIEGCEIVEESL